MSGVPQGGAIDLSRFSQAFFEECADHLGEIERLLLSMASVEPDGEELNTLFRAAHTIKGSAAIFGFTDITATTHNLESLLDRVRSREIPFSSEMVDLLLAAKDAIAMQLAGHVDGNEVDQTAVDEVCSRLRSWIVNGNPSPGKVLPHGEIVPPAEGLRCYRITFTPDRDLFCRGIRLENLFHELALMGELEVWARFAAPPSLEGFDPEQCLTRWEIRLLTASGENDIRDVFVFVAEEEQLQVLEIAQPEESAAAAANGMATDAVADIFPAPAPETAPGRNGGTERSGRSGTEADASIRVAIGKVDQLINQVGELVITQAMLSQIAGRLDPVLHEELHRGLLQLERNTRDLQQGVMSIRLVPISLVFSRFPRMVRELAAKLGKRVELKLAGEGTELDKGLVEKIADPLTHLVRNALDHALELPETRIAAGKDPVGTVTLRAAQVGGRIIIDVIDDGAGLCREKILAKAAERGITAAATISDEEVWHLIFTPGFSTADTVTDISGRGVGMDVVQKNVQALGGRVTIASEAGRGTRVGISLPLTLAIVQGLSVGIGEERFIIPLNAIVESLQPRTGDINTVNGKKLVHVRGDYLPIIPLFRLFGLKPAVTEPEQGILVLVEADDERVAILVDSLLDEHQVVVKSLEANYRRVEGTAGATILGDGRVALILDVHALVRMRNRCADGTP